MCPIFVYIYTFYVFTMQISPSVLPFVNHKTPAAFPGREISEAASEQSGTYNDIIIFLHLFLRFDSKNSKSMEHMLQDDTC